MSSVAEILRRMPIQTVVDEQLYDAQRKLLDHEAAAEHHAALAEMYRRRVQRLLHSAGQPEVGEAGSETAPIDLKTGKRLRA